MLKKIIDFIKNGVWQTTRDDYSSPKKWWAVRQFRVIIYTAKGFGLHDTAVRSAALSFYTVISLVPVLALVFVIFKGFGMEESFRHYLYQVFPQYDTLVDQLMVFVNNLLARTRGGIMAVSAFFVLIWAVIQVFGNVEAAFNNIWEVKRSRSFARRFSGYMTVIILLPIVWLASNSAFLAARQKIEIFTGSLVAEIFLAAAVAVVVILLFSLLYFVVPNTEVKFRHALKAGIVATVGFWLFQFIYMFIQTRLSSYNAIYGTFAAIPLFLLWLQTSWQILLFGGELSFAMQTIKNYEHRRQSKSMNNESRCRIMVAVMVIAVRDFIKGEKLATPESIAAELGLSVRLVREIGYELEENGLLLYVRDESKHKIEKLSPARDPHTIRFRDVVNAYMEQGEKVSANGNGESSPLMLRIDATYNRLKECADGDEANSLLTDLI